jgi:hypothetical protein
MQPVAVRIPFLVEKVPSGSRVLPDQRGRPRSHDVSGSALIRPGVLIPLD